MRMNDLIIAYNKYERKSCFFVSNLIYNIETNTKRKKKKLKN